MELLRRLRKLLQPIRQHRLEIRLGKIEEIIVAGQGRGEAGEGCGVAQGGEAVRVGEGDEIVFSAVAQEVGQEAILALDAVDLPHLGAAEPAVGDLDLHLNQYEVGIGPSQGKIAEKYLTGRTDKGCLIKRAAAPTLATATKTTPRGQPR